MPASGVLRVEPDRAIPQARIDLIGVGFLGGGHTVPVAWIGEDLARLAFASDTRLGVLIPADARAGRLPIRIGEMDTGSSVQVAAMLATGLHQVDSPVFDREGNLFVTFSGSRGQQVPVSIFRVRPDGTRETYLSGVVNPTSMAVGPDGALYVSSRFEGAVYRIHPNGESELFASDLGLACGLAFTDDGTLYVGDRSGTVFTVDHEGRARRFATLPPSGVAFHLALRKDGTLFVTAPTLSSRDVLHEIGPTGEVRTRPERFGRPQGMAFDRDGSLLVVEALAGVSGVYRIRDSAPPERVVAGVGLVGVAANPQGGLVVASNDTAYLLSED
jgi:glucose/arabinose dehydrogenase